MKRLRINVTQRDIDEGERSDCQNCPVALAMKRWLKDDCEINVVTDAVMIEWGIHNITVDLSEPAAMFTRAFDCNYKVSPFTFTLSLPKEVCK